MDYGTKLAMKLFIISIVLLVVFYQESHSAWIPARWVDDRHLANWYRLLKEIRNGRGLDKSPLASIIQNAKLSGPPIQPRFLEPSDDYPSHAHHINMSYLETPPGCGCPPDECVHSVEYIIEEEPPCPCSDKHVPDPSPVYHNPSHGYMEPIEETPIHKPSPYNPLSCGCPHHHSPVEITTTTESPPLPCGCPHHDYHMPPTEKPTPPPPKLPCGCHHHLPSIDIVPTTTTTTPRPINHYYECACKNNPTTPKPSCGCHVKVENINPNPPPVQNDPSYHHPQPSAGYHQEENPSQEPHPQATPIFIPTCQRSPPASPCHPKVLSSRPHHNTRCKHYYS